MAENVRNQKREEKNTACSVSAENRSQMKRCVDCFLLFVFAI